MLVGASNGNRLLTSTVEASGLSLGGCEEVESVMVKAGKGSRKRGFK